jgi:KDO2-lipid IV(A) lauroyltransferase
VASAAPPPAGRNGPLDQATALAYRGGALLARLMPRVALEGAGLVAATSFDLLGGERRRMVVRHQRRVAGRPLGPAAERRAVQAVVESYARYWSEAFRLPDVGAAELGARLTTEGLDHVDAALGTGHGVVLALPHLGGWEWAGAWMASRGYKLTVVVEPLHPTSLFDWFVELREGLGMSVVPLGPSAGGTVLAALGRNEVVCLVCDRDIGGGGVDVEFFGERTTLPGGPAMLALRARSTLLPTAVYFTGRSGHHGVVRPTVSLERRGTMRADVARITQDLAGELEGLIRRAPEQWHLLQPNWPSDRAS